MIEKTEDAPEWIKNARVRPQGPTTSPRELIKSKRELVDALANAGLSIAFDDQAQVVDVELDPDELMEVKQWGESRMLGLPQKLVRDRFIAEFMEDFNWVAAATRCGSASPVAFGNRMKRCGYVQRMISKKLAQWEAAAYVSKDKVAAVLWREANDFTDGTAATRVAAAAKLSKLLGYEVDIVNVNLHTHTKFIEEPLSKDEFIEMRKAFEEEY